MVKSVRQLQLGLICLLSLAIAQPGLAQFGGFGGFQSKVKPKPRDPNLFKSSFIAKQPQLPNLPEYPSTNCRIEGGEAFANLKNGPLYNYRLWVYEQPDYVANWYTQALKSNNWKIDTNQVTRDEGTTLMATRSDNRSFLTVNVHKSYKPRYKTEVLISYKVNN